MTDLANPDRYFFDELATWNDVLDPTQRMPVVSLYIPIDPLRRHIDRLELRSAVSWAEHALVHERGLARADAIAMLAPLSSPEYAGTAMGRVSTRSMAWFATAGHSMGIGLPGEVGPSVTIGDVADTLGLVPFAHRGPDYYVIVFSLTTARVFTADRFSIEELRIDDLPRGLDDALWYVRRESSMQRHGSGAVHSSGDSREHRKDDIRRYVQIMLDRIRPLLVHPWPIVVMGPGFEVAMVVDELGGRDAVALEEGRAESMSSMTVHERSWPLVSAYGRAVDAALDDVAELMGTGRVVTSAADIDEWSRQGAVATALVARRLTDPPRTQGVLDGDRALIADAVTQAGASGATVLVVDDDRLPSGAEAVAVLRW